MFTESISMEHIAQTQTVPKVIDGNLLLYSRQIVGVIGLENSGHSTFIEILSGQISARSGSIWIDGELCVRNGKTIDTLWKQSVWTLRHNTALTGSMTVAEFIVSPREDAASFAYIVRSRVIKAASETLNAYGLDIDPNVRGNTLSAAQQHLIYLMRAVHKGARLIIIDDVTSFYSVEETQLLGKTIRSISDNNIAVVCKLHNAGSIDYVDKLIVFRNGCSVKELHGNDVNAQNVSKYLYTGQTPHRIVAQTNRPGGIAIRVDRFTLDGRELSLSARYGEIAYIKVNAKRDSERLVQWLRAGGGAVTVGERIAFLPEIASSRCIFNNLSVADNLSISSEKSFSAGCFIKKHMLNFCEESFRRECMTGKHKQNVCQLSEREKYLLLFRRLSLTRPGVLLIENPWAYNDEEVCLCIAEEMQKAANRGVAVVVVTNSDLPLQDTTPSCANPDQINTKENIQ